MNIRDEYDTWTDLLAGRAAEAPDKLALCYVESSGREQPITYAELDERARRKACALQNHVVQGDRVLILLSSGLHYVEAFFAAIYAGAIPVTGYPPKAGRISARIKSIIKDCAPAAIMTDADCIRLLSEGDQAAALGFRGALLNVAHFDENVDVTGLIARPVSEIALLQYTSGSTSDPKGVMVSHRNLFHNCELLIEGMGFDRDSVVASWLPLHHDMGLIGKILCSLYAKVPCYFMAPSLFSKSPYLWLKLISDKRCTISGAPNFAYDACVKRISEEQKKTLDLSTWRVAWNGAEPVRSRTLAEFNAAFADCGLHREAMHPCYGLAEATLFVTSQRLDCVSVERRIDARAMADGEFAIADASTARSLDYVSVGVTYGDTTLKIVDPATREERGDGHIGEIWISNSSVGSGYWEKPEETTAKFRAELSETDGRRYFRTGDLGARLKGEIYITGRIKDVFIADGRNVYPQDIEATIEAAVAAVERSVVFAINEAVVTDESVPRVAAVCEIEREIEKDAEALARICATIATQVQIESEIGLDTIFLVSRGKIPRTSSGKVQRSQTRASILADEINAVHCWRAPASRDNRDEKNDLALEKIGETVAVSIDAHRLMDIVRRTADLPSGVVTPRTRALELGLSSLQLHEFLFEVEAISGRRLNVDEVLSSNPSFEEMAASLSGTDAVSSERSASAAAEVNASAALAAGRAQAPPRAEADRNVLLMHEKYQQTVENASHPFISALNPEFGRRLAQLKLDKEFVRGEGMYLYDTDGVCYLDFLSQYGSLPFGHNPHEIWEAVEDFRTSAMPAMVQPSLLHMAGRLAERLVRAAPGDIAYATFANSGAEAIEAAIKLARSSTGRMNILATRNGYHGKTLGALSATGREKYRKLFGVSTDFHHIPYDDASALEQALKSGEYAAFIVEPIQGEAGVIVPSQDYLPRAQALCREHGTLLVVDEVQTGIGRTGSMFYSEQVGIEPDIITVAKGLGGGLVPIGVCLSGRRVYNDEFGNKHTSTFAGNGLAAAVGLRTMDLLERDDGAMMKRVSEIGIRLKRSLFELQRKHSHLIKAVRGVGLMLAVHVSIDRYRFGSGLLASVAEEDFVTSLLMSHLLNHEKVRVAFTLNDGNVLRVQPPLTVQWEECERFVEALDRTLTALSTRNMATMAGHLVGLPPEPGVRSPVYEDDFLRPYHVNGRPHFGFLLHPLSPKTYVDFDVSLSAFDQEQLTDIGRIFGDNFEPFLGGENQLLSDTGEIVTGQFWVVPRTASDLVTMPQRQALMEVQEALSKALETGAKVIGLGAYTSSVTQGGLLLKAPKDVVITTGNTFTTLAGFLSIEEALTKEGRELSDTSIAILGATGSIGRALALLLAPRVRRLILVGNPKSGLASVRRMRAICSEIMATDRSKRLADGPPGELQRTIDRLRGDHDDKQILQRLEASGLLQLTTSCDDGLPQADVIATATNSPEAMIESRHLKQGAVICDISRPSNVDEALMRDHDDVCYFDGGVVRLPAGARLGLHTDLAEGLGYACMAETMMIALEGNAAIASRGIEVNMSNIPIFDRLYRKHGFQIHLPLRTCPKSRAAALKIAS